MRRIPSAGKWSRLGTADSSAPVEEKPAMEVAFGEDFWIDTCEVGAAGYAALMGAPDTADPRQPATGMSWYDALLYCNARSKRSGLDTVYEYAQARFSAGSCYALEGLSRRLDRDGIRLPTEAEWEYAASGGHETIFPWGNDPDSGEASAWDARNSGGLPHAIGALRPNGFGLYDMAGNVCEWVQDFKGPFRPGRYRDFLGASDGGAAPQIPVKGGCYRFDPAMLRITVRSAIYPTPPSGRAAYIGFRCARGPIRGGIAFDPSGNPAAPSDLQLNMAGLRDLLGPGPAKVVWVQASGAASHLDYVDLREPGTPLREFTDFSPVFYPAISPDGQWVAFGTGPEGSVTGSRVWVRKLQPGSPLLALPDSAAFIPRWWVDTATRDTFLVWTNSAIDDARLSWVGTRTLKTRFGDGKFGPTTSLSDRGSFHDGLSRDGRYLVTAFTRFLARDLETGADRTLFTGPDNGKAAGDTSQVCNLSLSPTGDRALFLDFGYPAKSALTGGSYGLHQLLFNMSLDGKSLRWYSAPTGEAGWEDAEWSNQGGFAISGATDPQGANRRLYAVDLEAGKTTLFAWGEDLRYPGLWMGEAQALPGGLDGDSLGKYSDPPGREGQTIYFGAKMGCFWKNREDAEIVFLGSSHVKCGIEPHVFRSGKALNLGYPGCGASVTLDLLEHYVLPLCPRLKVVVLELPPFMRRPGGEYIWPAEAFGTKGYAYDSGHGFWAAGWPEGFTQAIKAASPTLPEVDSLGYEWHPDNGWGKLDLVDTNIHLDSAQYLANFALVRRMAQDVSVRGLRCLFVNFPESPQYAANGLFMMWLPNIEDGRRYMHDAAALGEVSPLVRFYDAHRFGQHDYGDSDALTSDHLSTRGAVKLSGRLDSLLGSWLGE